MAYDDFFRLPFAKVEEMEKTFNQVRDNGISDADVLSFRNRLESDLKLALYFIIGWLAYLDVEAFGADKGEEDGAYNGFCDRDDEESEDVEDDQAEEAGATAGSA